ncbi:MAG TPA: hypothetical protein VMR20_10750, partial [Verrucomicrobiae bacterium]|nr:hypothetical protein [Verrucomicrobiae bacterium]
RFDYVRVGVNCTHPVLLDAAVARAGRGLTRALFRPADSACGTTSCAHPVRGLVASTAGFL